MDGHAAAGTGFVFGDDSGSCLKQRFTCYVSRGGPDISLDPVAFVVTVASGAADVAEGIQETSSQLGRALRKGSSIAGKNLKRFAKFSDKVDKLAPAGGPLIVAAFVIDVAGDQKVGRAAARAAPRSPLEPVLSRASSRSRLEASRVRAAFAKLYDRFVGADKPKRRGGGRRR